MASLFEKFKRGLTKTREGFVGEIQQLVNNTFEVDEDFLEKIEEILISSDLGVDTSFDVIAELREHVNQVGFNQSNELFDLLKNHLQTEIHNNAGQASDFFKLSSKPFVIVVVGVNGAGKTTTIAKLAKVFHDQGKKVLLAAADTFRAAASDQLKIWADRIDVEIIINQPGGDPAAVAFDACKAALARKVDVVIVDTAGRLHTKVNLMEELKKIYRVTGNAIAGAPHETLLVLDATTGQNAINQAKQFKNAVDVTGLIVTKLDGTAKGGMIFSVQKQLGLPVKFIGLGEQMDDLREFDPKTFVEALFE